MDKHIIALKENSKDNPAVLGLLDVIAQILADEYIETAKQKPEAFLDKHG